MNHSTEAGTNPDWDFKPVDSYNCRPATWTYKRDGRTLAFIRRNPAKGARWIDGVFTPGPEPDYELNVPGVDGFRGRTIATLEQAQEQALRDIATLDEEKKA